VQDVKEVGHGSRSSNARSAASDIIVKELLHRAQRRFSMAAAALVVPPGAQSLTVDVEGEQRAWTDP
jgi:hypothetical protein